MHKAVRKFYLQQQDPGMSNSNYIKNFQSNINAIESVGATYGVHESPVDEELTKV